MRLHAGHMLRASQCEVDFRQKEGRGMAAMTSTMKRKVFMIGVAVIFRMIFGSHEMTHQALPKRIFVKRLMFLVMRYQVRNSS